MQNYICVTNFNLTNTFIFIVGCNALYYLYLEGAFEIIIQGCHIHNESQNQI